VARPSGSSMGGRRTSAQGGRTAAVAVAGAVAIGMWAGAMLSSFAVSAAAADVGPDHYRAIPLQQKLTAVARLPRIIPMVASGAATGAVTIVLAGVMGGWDRRRMAPWLIRSCLGWLPLSAVVILGLEADGLSDMGVRRLAVGVAGAALVGSWGLQLWLTVRDSLWKRLVETHRWRGLGALAFACLLPLSFWASLAQWPTGDEPHYLLVAQSLVADGDLDIRNNHGTGEYRLFYPTEITHAHAIAGRGGQWFSKHSPGLPFLIAPFYALAGRWAVVALMTATAACLTVSLQRLASDAGSGSDRVASLGWWLTFSMPVLAYANQVFPAVPVALAVAEGCRLWIRPNASRHRVAAVCTGLAVIPWLHLGSAQLALPLLAAVWLRVRRTSRIPWWATALPCLVCGLLPLFYWATLGRPLPALGAFGTYSLAQSPGVLLRLLVDQEHGLLVYAPLWVGAAWGFRRAMHLQRWRVPSVVGFGYVLTVASWNWWYGGWAPVGRFLVPVLPILMVPLGLSRRGVGSGERVLGVWGFLVGLALTAYPAWRYNAHDGSAALLDSVESVVGWELHQLFPSDTGMGFLLAGLYLAGFLCASRPWDAAARALGEGIRCP
jgi:hypothetical protein